VVQISDPHLDIKYKAGSTVDCGMSFCCREESETGQGSTKAGKFGTLDGRCDIPPETFVSAL